jgi:hypothetical protein
MTESLSLKWGTLKAWILETERSKELMKRYVNIGASMSAMAQEDTTEQKNIICELIDEIDGAIHNDWSGEIMSKEDAKKYVLEYRSRS